MVKPATWLDICAVARAMRECDRREICGLAATEDPLKAIEALAIMPYFGVTVWRETPVVAIGAMLLHPGVASIFMFATDGWSDRSVRAETARYVRRGLVPTLLAAGVHRMQAPASVEHVESHKWMERFGAKPESVMRGYGKNGENYVLFVMDRAAMGRVTSVAK